MSARMQRVSRVLSFRQASQSGQRLQFARWRNLKSGLCSKCFLGVAFGSLIFYLSSWIVSSSFLRPMSASLLRTALRMKSDFETWAFK